MSWVLIPIRDTELEVEVLGSGDPVVIVQTALSADELRPLADMVQRRGHQVVHYHRRGYAGSGAAAMDSSVTEDAADCRALMAALDIGSARVVGVSYSAAMALSLASSAPECVRTLTVVEPPPVHVPSTAQFRAANAQLTETFAVHGSGAALEQFLLMLVGPDGRRECERQLPGSVPAMERDAPTFFRSDVPAMLDWTFTAADAARIRCPVLYVGGSESGPWFAEVREWVGQLLPQVHDTSVGGAGHMLAVTHPAEVADRLIDFVRETVGMEMHDVAEMAARLDGVRRTDPGELTQWRYHGRLVARQLDGAHIVIRADFDYRDLLLRQFPDTFSVPNRFAKHMMIVADLAAADAGAIEDALIAAWELQHNVD